MVRKIFFFNLSYFVVIMSSCSTCSWAAQYIWIKSCSFLLPYQNGLPQLKTIVAILLLRSMNHILTQAGRDGLRKTYQESLLLAVFVQGHNKRTQIIHTSSDSNLSSSNSIFPFSQQWVAHILLNLLSQCSYYFFSPLMSIQFTRKALEMNEKYAA